MVNSSDLMRSAICFILIGQQKKTPGDVQRKTERFGSNGPTGLNLGDVTLNRTLVQTIFSFFFPLGVRLNIV